jgi:soluble lytic murein transglycosylase-like protein
LLSSFRSTLPILCLAGILSGCSIDTISSQRVTTGPIVLARASGDTGAPAGKQQLDGLISRYANIYNMPEKLLRRVIARESGYNAQAHRGSYYGLMQITLSTARTMGFRGEARELLSAETNLRYGGKYLAGAYMVAGNNEDRALGLYSRGYYYDAKRKGMLVKAGLAGGN